MNNERRKRYRAALRDAGAIRTDRLTDMMTALTSGGTTACASCTLVRPVATLDEQGVCGLCRTALGRVKKRAPAPTPLVTRRVEPNVVWVDASFRDGRAGLAVTGALGEHTQAIPADTSTQAEVLALGWALEIAKQANTSALTFRTDCQAAWRMLSETPADMPWKVEWVPRAHNQRADHLARAALHPLLFALPGPGRGRGVKPGSLTVRPSSAAHVPAHPSD